MKQRIALTALLFMAPILSGFSQDIAEPLTLDRVLSLYIERNLELQAERFKVERSRADQIAAPLRPNATVSVTAENLRLSGPIAAGRLYEVGGTYSETFELGGKRGLRQKLADASVSSAEARFADVLRHGLAGVKRLYFEAALARRNIQLATDNRQTFEQLLQFNLARFQEGAIPESELIRVRLERIKFDSAVRKAQLVHRQAMIQLAENLEDDTVAGRSVADEPPLRMIASTEQSLLEAALRERPDVQAAQRDILAARQKLALEEARSKPDITSFAGFKRVGNDNTVLAGVSIPLKIRDRNQAQIARAQSDLKAAETLYEVAKSHTAAEVAAAFAAVATARELVETFRSEMLNQADESRSIALAAYEEGATPLATLLEAQRTRAEIQEQYFKTLFDYQISVSELEFAIGKEVQP